MAYNLSYTYDNVAKHYLVAGWADITPTDKVIIPPKYDDGIHGVHSVAKIGYEAFRDCETLTSINIPYSVTTIIERAFYGCKNLTSINIPYGVTKIESGAFAFCTSLTSITIPDSVTSLGVGAFNNCNSLRSVIISNNLTSISDYAFQYCYRLTSITIPDSVTSIGKYAFLNCYQLLGVIVGNNVTLIDNRAFQGCHNLRTTVLLPETPPTLGDSIYFETGITTIYVQYSVKETYKTAENWSLFADKITDDDFYLSFARFNQKNKEYIAKQIKSLQEYIDGRL